ncbi:ATP-grasp domain-containing protein [Pseudactinotalea terrae]|uniref:ATP-grasp domain-containing protein n=1 Tax=Pseudactinotalea terrae TaxID=1743262 RepID=UPI0012E226B9|nr:ATP-grasp domain-containing protein [Pseudactinotalea terrae]
MSCIASRFDQLRVVSSARWLAQDLVAAQVLPVVHDLGLDVRSRSPRTAWWAPMRFASRLVATTGRNPFAAPGPHFTAGLDRRWTARLVMTTTVADLTAGAHVALDGPVHVKPAELKHSGLPAQVVTDTGAARAAVAAAGLDPGTVVQLSKVIDPVAEFRAFVRHGKVVTVSAYLVAGVTWDAWSSQDAPEAGEAARFAADVAASVAGPDGYVLDVARTRQGAWVVLEANPAWSSNPYHCDPAAVVTTVLAAHQQGAHRWRIDPWLQRTARPLPVCEGA